MAEYRLLIKDSAAKQMAVGAKADRRRIVKHIRELAQDPWRQGLEKLAGSAERYRAGKNGSESFTSLMTGVVR